MLKTISFIMTICWLVGSNADAADFASVLDNKPIFTAICRDFGPVEFKSLYEVSTKARLVELARRNNNIQILCNQFNDLKPSLSNKKIVTLLNKTIFSKRAGADFIRALQDLSSREGCLFVPKSFPMTYFLLAHLRRVGGAQLFEHLSLNESLSGQLYQAMFHVPLPEDQESKNRAFQYLVSCFPIDILYFPTGSAEEALNKFWTEQNTAMTLGCLSVLRAKQPHVGFQNLLAFREQLDTTPHTIVLTDTEANEENNRVLDEVLEKNPNHLVALNVGNVFVDANGLFNLRGYHLPRNVQHLRITNYQGNATIIDEHFLHGILHLQSLVFLTMGSVTTIRDNFVRANGTIQSFDGTGLTGVQSIGDKCLSYCPKLTFLYSLGLPSVQSIGKDFVSECRELPSFDTSVMTHLTSVGNGCMHLCYNLSSFDSSGLIRLLTIGEYFLANTSLRFLDTSFMSTVTSFKMDFLYNCLLLEYLKGSDLSSVPVIEPYFLALCPKLTFFDTTGMVIKSIMNHFLYTCPELLWFDSSGLTKDTFIEYYFLKKCDKLQTIYYIDDSVMELIKKALDKDVVDRIAWVKKEIKIPVAE